MAKRKLEIKKQVQEELSHLVFVYGTLKRGGSNHFMLDVPGAKFLSELTLPAGDFKMINVTNRYPALIYLPDDEKTTEIHGELYAITNTVMKTLDILEGYKGVDMENLFNKYIYIINDEGSFLSKVDFFYIYIAGERLLRHLTGNPRVEFPEIPSGNWEIKKL